MGDGLRERVFDTVLSGGSDSMLFTAASAAAAAFGEASSRLSARAAKPSRRALERVRGEGNGC